MPPVSLRALLGADDILRPIASRDVLGASGSVWAKTGSVCTVFGLGDQLQFTKSRSLGGRVFPRTKLWPVVELALFS